VLGKVLPEMIKLVLAENNFRKTVEIFLKAIQKFPYHDHDCVATHSLYLELSKVNEEESFPAFLVWLHARHVVSDKESYQQLDDDNKVICDYVSNVLEYSTRKYAKRYVRLLELGEWTTLNEWHKKYSVALRWFIPDAVDAIYKVRRFYVSEKYFFTLKC
jgi:hypothetical protein